MPEVQVSLLEPAKSEPRLGELRRARKIGYKGHSYFIWHACQRCGAQRWVLYGKNGVTDTICRNCKRNGPKPKAVRERLLSNIRPEGDCWVWMGFRNTWGYGTIKVRGEILLAHRVSYEEFVTAIPEGLEIDHLCRNRMCINPAHLEPVPHIVNVQRGLAGKYPSNGDQERRKTHCPHGHPYDLFNTHWTKLGHRECKACWREKNQRRRRKCHSNLAKQ